MPVIAKNIPCFALTAVTILQYAELADTCPITNQTKPYLTGSYVEYSPHE